MDKASNGVIGSREVFLITLFIIGTKITDMTPTFLYDKGMNSTWVLPLISGAFIIIPFLVVLSLLKKYQNKGLIDIIYTLSGKYVGFVISIYIFLQYLFITSINSRNYTDVLLTMYFPKTPRMIAYLALIAACYFIANRGLEAIGRTVWVLFPMLFIVGLILIFFLKKETQVAFLYPLVGPGAMELLKQGFNNNSILSDIFVLAVFFPFVSSYKDFKKSTL